MPNPIPAQTLSQGGPDPLTALPPLAAPAPVSWWPPAPGWWLLFALLLIASWILLRLVLRSLRRRRLINTLVADLQRARDAHAQDNNNAAYLYAVNRTLRRLALRSDTAQQALHASGKNWLALLDQLGEQPLSADRHAKSLLDQYRPNPSVDVGALHNALLAWSKGLRADRLQIGRPAGHNASIRLRIARGAVR